jgi:hypothetical protein
MLTAMLFWHMAENQRRPPQNPSSLDLRSINYWMYICGHHFCDFWLCPDYSNCSVRQDFSLYVIFYANHSSMSSFSSFVIALGELPFCLGWIPSVKNWSASIAPYLEQYWARALVYSGSVSPQVFSQHWSKNVLRSTGLGWCFAYELDRDCWWIVFWGVCLMISGILYGWAYLVGERFEDEVMLCLSIQTSFYFVFRIKVSRAWASMTINFGSKLNAMLLTRQFLMSYLSTHPVLRPLPLLRHPCQDSLPRFQTTKLFA